MNRAYRFVWSKAKGRWDLASEITKGKGGPREAGGVIARRSLLCAALLLAPLSAWAGPAGEQLVAGSATVSRPNATTTIINQQSAKAILNWNSFSIAGPELVRFNQPNAASIALNRVVGSDPSRIFGQLQANGQVFLVNPNGVLFAPGSQVSVHGLLATTHDIRNDDFMAGRYSFSRQEGAIPSAEVINQGLLAAADSGYIVLAGDYAANEGIVTARLGKVVLAAGESFTLDLEGDELIGLTVDAASLAKRAGVENFGEISADGGKVLMTARVAGELAGAVVNNEGLIRARTIEEKNGEIYLLAGMSGGVFTESNTVRVGGTLDASAPNGGNGGFIETSGAKVELVQPIVTAAAPYGKGGRWLIDPTDITIDATYAGSIANSLGTDTDVTVQTIGTGTDQGNITVSADIVRTGGSAQKTLTLSAHNNINLNAGIASSTGGALDIVLNADSDNNSSGIINLAAVTLDGNGGAITATGKTVNHSTGTATINSPMTMGGLNLSGGTLGGSGALTVTGAFTWSGGTISGAGSLTTTGTTTLSGTGTKYLQDKTWNNSGTMNLTGGNLYFYDTSTTGVPAFNNLTGGVVTMTSTSSNPFYGSGTFSNAGTLNYKAKPPALLGRIEKAML